MVRISRQLRVTLALACSLSLQAHAADGDINSDGVIDAADVLWTGQHILEGRSLLPEQFANGDLTPLLEGTPQPDGSIDSSDYSLIVRIALGQFNYAWSKNQFNIGDSIGVAEAASGDIGAANYGRVWSTGYNDTVGVNSMNLRFEAGSPTTYQQNSLADNPVFNHAVSGAVMADFQTQAQGVIAASAQTLAGDADMVTILLGNNDVCAPSLATMTDPVAFETQYKAGLDELAADEATKDAQIHVSSIPAIYWLWDAKRSNFWCTVFVWPQVPCEVLLDDPGDDCESAVSRNDPDNNNYPGDGPACKRRKDFHLAIRDTYNPILRDVLAEYREDGRLPNARYIDVFGTRFTSTHVNSGDCFHPSTEGHALLAQEEWCRTHWGIGDPACNN